MKKTNSEQFQKLVAMMEENSDIAKGVGNFGSSKKISHEFWENAAVCLNSVGPPTRDGIQWHKVWLDYKLKLKKKIATNKKGITGTGGGRYTQISLSPLEQAVDSLLGLQHAVDPRGICFGGSGSGVEDVGDNEDILQTMDSTTTPTTVPDTPLQSRGREMPTTLRQRNTRQQDKTDSREEERVQLLKQQNTNQMDMLSTLTSIKENLSELARYNRKLYDLQKEKLVLLKAKEKRKEKENFDANRRHKEKLEVNLRMVKMKEAKYFK